MHIVRLALWETHLTLSPLVSVSSTAVHSWLWTVRRLRVICILYPVHCTEPDHSKREAEEAQLEVSSGGVSVHELVLAPCYTYIIDQLENPESSLHRQGRLVQNYGLSSATGSPVPTFVRKR